MSQNKARDPSPSEIFITQGLVVQFTSRMKEVSSEVSIFYFFNSRVLYLKNKVRAFLSSSYSNSSSIRVDTAPVANRAG